MPLGLLFLTHSVHATTQQLCKPMKKAQAIQAVWICFMQVRLHLLLCSVPCVPKKLCDEWLCTCRSRARCMAIASTPTQRSTWPTSTLPSACPSWPTLPPSLLHPRLAVPPVSHNTFALGNFAGPSHPCRKGLHWFCPARQKNSVTLNMSRPSGRC